MSTQGLDIRRSSASVLGSASGLRTLTTVSKYIDTSTCIGCKACEVACQEWNDLKPVATHQAGTYQTLPTLHSEYWNLIRFNERDFDGGIVWLMRKDQCMHCDEPGCLAACPAPGAIVQYANGIVDVNPDQCIGCRYCETGCPFDVPRFSQTTGKMSKCTLCVDRVSVGLEPACIKACPTGCLHFGTKEDMLELAHSRVDQLKAHGFQHASVYDPAGVGGTSVVTVLAHGENPEWYNLPRDPHVPILVKFWKNVLRPLGAVAVFGAVIGAFGHFMNHGRKGVKGADANDANLPDA
jgi:formate dehydrogenase iron-sulfur subunit